MTDKQTTSERTYRYCHCTRHETKHEERLCYTEPFIFGGGYGEYYAFFCTECGEEKST